MKASTEKQSDRIAIWSWVFALLWAVFILAMLLDNRRSARLEMETSALREARTAFQNEIAPRSWDVVQRAAVQPDAREASASFRLAAAHKPVFVSTNALEPAFAFRDWTAEPGAIREPAVDGPSEGLPFDGASNHTSAGTEAPVSMTPLSAVAPAHRPAFEMPGLRGRIVGLKPLQSENAPDAWEAAALKRLNEDRAEFSEVVSSNGTLRLRFVGRLVAQARCLTCHAESAREGGVLGGISLSVPLDSEGFQAASAHRAKMNIFLMGVGVLGLAGICAGGLIVHRRQRESEQALASLRASEEHFRSTYQNAPVAYQFLDAEGRLTEVNGAWSGLFGFSFEEALHMPLASFLDPAETPRFQQHFQRFMAASRAPTAEFQFRRKDGAFVIVSLDGRVVRDVEGSAKRSHWVLHNITERKKAELRIGRMNRVYAVLSDINEAIVRLDDRPTLFAAVCRIAVEKGGFRMAWIGLLDAAGQRVEVAAKAGETGDYLEKMNIVLADEPRGHGPTAEAFRSGHHVICGDIERDPRMAPWREDARRMGYRALAAFPLAVAGKTIGVFGLFTAQPGFFDEEEVRLLDELAEDISFALEVHRREVERRQAEAALRESEARVRQQAALLDQTQDVVLVAGLDQRLRYCNRSAELFYGRPARQLLEQNVGTLLFSGAPERCAEACRSTLDDGSWSGESRSTAGDGGVRTVFSRWTLIHDAFSQPDCFLVVNTDMTEKKRLEEHLLRAQRMENIGTLASGVAHDLNNILAPIMIATDVLRPLARKPEEREVLEMLKSGAERGSDVVRQLLTFGRGAGAQRGEIRPRTLLKEMAKVIKETFPKNLVIEQQFPDDLWTIHADPTQVHQVLLNLCVNARDAMPNGGKLSLSAENLVLDEHYAAVNVEAKPGPYVVMEVNDTGEGIPPEILNKIFDPFFTTKEVGKGTGLGLSTVLGILNSHGGFTQVSSRVGEGTQFKVYFPALSGQANQPAATIIQRPPKGHGELILVVDDEEAIRSVAQRLLSRSGYRVLTAANGSEGLAAFSRNRGEISAVILDMMMPVMDGAALIRGLRELSPQLRLMAMSGLATQQEEAENAGLGDGVFLMKPFMPETLLAQLHKVLGPGKAG